MGPGTAVNPDIIPPATSPLLNLSAASATDIAAPAKGTALPRVFAKPLAAPTLAVVAPFVINCVAFALLGYLVAAFCASLAPLVALSALIPTSVYFVPGIFILEPVPGLYATGIFSPVDLPAALKSADLCAALLPAVLLPPASAAAPARANSSAAAPLLEGSMKTPLLP